VSASSYTFQVLASRDRVAKVDGAAGNSLEAASKTACLTYDDRVRAAAAGRLVDPLSSFALGC